jgi:hypothetical protein
MSIQVSYGSDTYSFASKDGRSYWFLSDTKSTSFLKMVGMIANSDMNTILYEAAISQGYTSRDFDKMRTYAPIKSSERKVKARSPRIAVSRKPAVRKSNLNNSIKLF